MRDESDAVPTGGGFLCGKPLRRPAVRCCTPRMILRSFALRLGLGALFFAAVAASFLVLDLYA